jgi:hypothetical protein
MEPSPLRIRVRGGSIAAENLMMAGPRAGNALTEDCSTEIDSSDGEWDWEEGELRVPMRDSSEAIP